MVGLAWHHYGEVVAVKPTPLLRVDAGGMTCWQTFPVNVCAILFCSTTFLCVVIYLTQMAGSDLRCCFCFLNRGVRSRHYDSVAVVGGKHGFITGIGR